MCWMVQDFVKRTRSAIRITQPQCTVIKVRVHRCWMLEMSFRQTTQGSRIPCTVNDGSTSQTLPSSTSMGRLCHVWTTQQTRQPPGAKYSNSSRSVLKSMFRFVLHENTESAKLLFFLGTYDKWTLRVTLIKLHTSTQMRCYQVECSIAWRVPLSLSAVES